MNEPYFGSLKRKYSQCMNMGIGGLAAQAIEEQNGSFKEGARLSKLIKLAVLVVRKWARGQRSRTREMLKERRTTQAKRKLAMRVAHVEDMLENARERYARSLVEWNVEVDTLEEYERHMANKDTTCGLCHTHTDKEQKTKAIYNAIQYGWGQGQYHTNASCNDKGAKCSLGCSMKVHTGYDKKDKHGRMMEHVKKMLAMVKSGVIKRPSAPLIPGMGIRPHGDIALGSRTEQRKGML